MIRNKCNQDTNLKPEICELLNKCNQDTNLKSEICELLIPATPHNHK